MKTSRISASSALLALALTSTPAVAADGWGAGFSFGPSTSRIIHAKTTLVPGRFPPMSKVGPLFLWPGMSNSKGDLIQTTMDAYSDNSFCGATSTQWCVEASVFGSFGQRNGPAVAIDPDDHVTIDYKLGTDGNTWTQTVTSQKLGKVVSTLQSASGPMPGTGFGFATEADADSFTIDNQYYLCTELDFAEADPKFGSTGVGAAGAKYGATGTGSGPGTAKNLRTPDSGLTWLVDLITLPPMNPQGAQTPAPTINCETGGGGSGTGGATGSGGTTTNGGSTSSGGKASNGGSTGVGGALATGGKSAAGGAASSGGTGGGKASTGGSAATLGGASAMGGSAFGGAIGAGGLPANEGTPSAGGNFALGGALGTGGAVGVGGSPTGGAAASTGGKTSGAGGSRAVAGSASGDTGSNGGCSCSVPGGNAPRGALALAVGAAFARRLRRRRR